MFDHIGLGVSDYAKSKAFFLKSLQPLGVGIVMEGEQGLGLGPKGKSALWRRSVIDPRLDPDRPLRETQVVRG